MNLSSKLVRTLTDGIEDLMSKELEMKDLAFCEDTLKQIIKIANDIKVDSYRIMKFIETGRGNDNKNVLQITPDEFKQFINDYNLGAYLEEWKQEQQEQVPNIPEPEIPTPTSLDYMDIGR